MAAALDSMQQLPRLALRPMLEADLLQVHANEVLAYPFPWSDGIFRDCLRVGYVSRVLELDGRVVGHGVLSIGAGEAHLLNLCVRAEYRCRGMGKALLSQLFERARACGASVVFLEVRPTNTGAIRLYETLGFEQVGMRRGYYQAAQGREDACVLRMKLC